MTRNELKHYRQGMLYAARLARAQGEAWEERREAMRRQHAANINITADWSDSAIDAAVQAVEEYRDAIRARALEIASRRRGPRRPTASCA